MYRTRGIGLWIPMQGQGLFNSVGVLQGGPRMERTQQEDSLFLSRVCSNMIGYTAAALIGRCTSGTELIVRGQANVIPASTNSMLRCTIDGVEGESEVVTSGNLRSWKMCGRSSLSEGRHQVVVNITAGPNTVLWMDEIYYYSLNRPNLRRQWSMLYPNTEEFRYTGVSWSNPFDEGGNHGRESYQNGAKATIPFYGSLLCLLLHSLLINP